MTGGDEGSFERISAGGSDSLSATTEPSGEPSGGASTSSGRLSGESGCEW